MSDRIGGSPLLPKKKETFCTCCFWCQQKEGSKVIIDNKPVFLHTQCEMPYKEWLKK